MEITDSQLRAAYSVAKRVFEKEIKLASGAHELVEHFGMNPASARDVINNFGLMMNGQIFTRTISAMGAEIYLSGIEADYGTDALARAISSLYLHLKYYERLRKVTLHKLRSVIAQFEQRLDRPIDAEHQQANFLRAVALSMADSSEARSKRLAGASTIPPKVVASTYIFLRNQDVVAEVLIRANGSCEACGNPAPFARKSDGTPYLEVHHKIPLANGGHDSVENAIAVCPNCHRKFHYGA